MVGITLAPLDSIFGKRDVVLEVVVEVPLILDVFYYRRDVVYCREDAEIEVGITLALLDSIYCRRKVETDAVAPTP